MKTKMLWLVATVGVGFVFHGCGGGTTQESYGSASIAALTTADVTRVEVTVSGPNITPDIVQSLAFGGGQWSGVINGIPIGTNTFLAQAFDAADALIYSGTAQGTVVEGQPLGITIYLQQETAPDPFNNTVPSFQSVVISPGDPAPNEDVTLTVTVTDPDPGDTVDLLWTPTAGVVSPNNTATVVWTTPGVEGGQALNVAATDDSGAQAILSIAINVAYPTGDATTVNVDLNTWPVATNLVPTPTRVDVGGVDTTSLDLTASDNDAGDTLSFSWSADCTGSFSDDTAEDPTFTLAIDNGGAPCTLTVTVTDGRGGSTTASVAVQTGPEVQATEPPAVTCPCWNGDSGRPVSLAAYWSTATDCSGTDYCQNGTSGFDTLARCGVDGVNYTHSTYVTDATDNRCAIQLSPGSTTQLPFLSNEQYAVCLAEHQAFTQNKNGNGCGLPNP